MNANLQIKMDLSDIIFYIVFAIIGIFSTAAQNKGKKKSEKKPQPRHEINTQDESNTPLPEVEYTEYSSEDNELLETVEKEIPTEETTHTPAEYTLEEIFQALREGTPLKPKKKVEPIEVEISTTTSQENQSPTPQPVTPTYIEGERAISDISGNEITDDNIYDNSQAESRFNTQEVDWKQAVITSEILTRKY